MRDQDFGRTADRWHGGAAVAQFPSIDLAVAAASGPASDAPAAASRPGNGGNGGIGGSGTR